MNHPETIPSNPLVYRKIIFHEIGPLVPERLGTAGW